MDKSYGTFLNPRTCEPKTVTPSTDPEPMPVLARLACLRSQLRRVLGNLESVDGRVRGGPVDRGHENRPDADDLTGLVADCEQLTNHVVEVANAIDQALGSVGPVQECGGR